MRFVVPKLLDFLGIVSKYIINNSKNMFLYIQLKLIFHFFLLNPKFLDFRI
jgi:hypothetical protein